MRLRVFNALLFAGLAVWELFRHAWAAPGFFMLAASQLILPIAVWRGVGDRGGFRALVLFLALGYLGLAYLVSGFAGQPTTTGFWVAFGAAALVLGPVVWLFHRITLGKAAHH